MDFLNKIIHSSLRNRLSVAILAALILMGGVWSMLRTEVDIFPDLNAPVVVVMTEAPGYAPEEVEKVVTYPVETAVNGAEGVRRVRSSSSVGFSVVWVEFDWDTEPYRARQIVSERLAAVASDMPAGVGTPTMGPQSSILGEIMIIGLTADPASDVSPMDLRAIADRTIRPRLLALGGVSSVAVMGGDAKQFQIRLDPARMKALSVTLDEVADAAGELNANASGGVVYDFGNEYIVKGEVNTSDPQEIAAATVRADSRGVVTLADVATVVEAGERPKLGEASVEGTPAVLITVTKQPAQGTGSLTGRIDGALADIAAELPEGVVIKTDIFRQNDFIRQSIGNLQQSLFEGALFVILVLFFCMMNLRTTIISVVALPVSIIVSILVLNMLGFTVNTMSLGGIAIAIGSLVDDAIVDVENVYKRLRANRALPPAERMPSLEVIYRASAEVRTPIFNSSLIIIAGFLPLFFLSGIEGRMLIPLGVAFVVALMASTVVALTLTPVLCSWLLGRDRTDNAALGREPWLSRKMRSAYAAALGRALRHKRALIAGTALLFAGALAGFFTLGRGFLPGFNEGSFTINVSTLPGVSLEESDRIGREAERIILSMPEVITVARKTGRAELDEHSLGANVSEIEAPYELKDRSRAELTRALRAGLATLPGVNVEIGQPISHRIDAMLSGTQAQIAVKLFGPDLTTLFRVGQQIRDAVSHVDGVADVNIEQQVERPELTIRPRRALMARHGVTMAQFRRFLEVSMAGVKVSEVYGDDGMPYDLILTVDPARRATLADVKELTVDTPSGPVPVTAIADVVSSAGPNTINREDTKRRVVISANTDGRDLRSVADDIRAAVESDVTLPEGYYVAYGGQFENEAAASRTLLLTSLGALLLILMLLYGEFRDWTQSLVILLNMPLAIIGGVFMLMATGGEVNIPAIIGFISLMGIATRNGMLLMSRYNALAREGLTPEQRVMQGSADRLLPIVMTALTSALALLPLALGADKPGNEIQSPMAVVILGGLISSTILNSFVLPATYLIIYKRKNH
ncbi:MAG: CusA/CzcA family heavy metal efflux RND transporter [Muribaculaceae bacterium]|nr:CusA/CzcA family heavy metal efflux RND transporter [Muribaculaceae bacterium]MDE6315997.1 CusA/CzcA family heavy metal efflux RND transporter [Muribaculaceae bacterium]